jgi:hypothetical protein
MGSASGYLVVGPESSGTRLTVRLLSAAGCRLVEIVGDDDGPELPLDGHRPVIRRSIPHACEWPTMRELVSLVPAERVHAVVTTRDWFAMAESQVGNGHTPDVETSHANIRRAYGEIFSGLVAAGVPYVASSYESLVREPSYAPRLLALLGLPPASVAMYDGNAKWYAGPSA